MVLKLCHGRCRALQSLAAFSSNAATSDGLSLMCRTCQNEQRRLLLRSSPRAGRLTSIRKAKKRGRPMKRRPYHSKYNPTGLPPDQRTP